MQATSRSNQRAPWLVIVSSLVVIVGMLTLYACHANSKRLVEVFDNGPIGGPRGGSEGYIWVGVNEEPPPGKGWMTVDESTLSDEDRQRIR